MIPGLGPQPVMPLPARRGRPHVEGAHSMGAENVFTASIAALWLAPVGTVAPEGPVVSMGTGWKNVGLFTPDSLSWSGDPEFSETEAHQSPYPVKVWQTKDAASLEV